MLSIVIPVYNVDVLTLVNTLSKQAQSLNISYELVCMDDASSEENDTREQ